MQVDGLENNARHKEKVRGACRGQHLAQGEGLWGHAASDNCMDLSRRHLWSSPGQFAFSSSWLPGPE